MNKSEQRLGFTLVELLVIVAVVFVLAALLIPNLTTRGHPVNKRAACLNNLKQIGLSLRLYSGDNSERFPCDSSATTLGSFALLTNNYQTSYKTWVCREDIGIVAGSPTSGWTKKNLSYAYGGFGLTESVQPDTPLACDRTSGTITGVSPYTGNSLTHKANGGNVLFADGHVAFQKGFNPPMYRAKNP